MTPKSFMDYAENIVEDYNGGELDPSEAVRALRKALEKVAP